MNVHELASSVYKNHYAAQATQLSSNSTVKNSSQLADSISRDFSEILSDYMETNDSDELISSIEELTDSIKALGASDENKTDTTDVMSILTDQEKAKEYLSNQPGRELILEMIQNSIAGIISGNN